MNDEPFVDTLRTEEDYCIRPSRERPGLTSRDFARNRGAKRLFNAVTPGLPIDADPVETRQEPATLSLALRSVITAIEGYHDPFADRVAVAWPTLFPALVGIAEPVRFANGTLTIAVPSSRYLFELRRTHLAAIQRAVRTLPEAPRTLRVTLVIKTTPSH